MGKQYNVDDILNEVTEVLKSAQKGRGPIPRGLSSFQILERLSMRDELIKQYGEPGKDTGNYHNAATMIAKACMRLADRNLVKFRYVDSCGMFFEVAGNKIEAGYGVCAFFQYVSGYAAGKKP